MRLLFPTSNTKQDHTDKDFVRTKSGTVSTPVSGDAADFIDAGDSLHHRPGKTISVNNIQISFGKGADVKAIIVGDLAYTWSGAEDVITSSDDVGVVPIKVTWDEIETWDNYPDIHNSNKEKIIYYVRVFYSKPTVEIYALENNNINIPEEGTELVVKGHAESDPNLPLAKIIWSMNGQTGESGFAFDHMSKLEWWISLKLPFNAIGQKTISVWSVDSEGTQSEPKSVTFIGRDFTPPHINIDSPSEDEIIEVPQFPSNDVVVTGLIKDPQSGVDLDSCRWELIGGLPGSACSGSFKPIDESGTFNFSIPINDWDTYLLSIEAADKADPKNKIIVLRNFATALEHKPSTIEEVFSPQMYLRALLYFIEHHVIQQDQKPLIASVLEDNFHQPFWKLCDPGSSIGDEPVNRLRVPIAVLKAAYGIQYSDILYLQTAYITLLTKIGTSYDELRLSKGTAEEESLARRLGIGKDHVKELLPLSFDQIDSLNGLSEDWLEKTFGLARTSYTNPYASKQIPLLLKWQKETLEQAWLAEDNLSILIDPDNVNVDDLIKDDKGQPLYQVGKELINQREQDIQGFENDISGQWPWPTPAGSSAKEGFDKAISSVFPTLSLKELAKKDDDGQAIDAELQNFHLSRTAFVRLCRIQALADAGNVSEAERNDVIAILTQVRKEEWYSTWKANEKSKSVVLSPQYFLSDQQQAQRPWRFSASARYEWQRKLKGRKDDETVLETSLSQSIAETEEITLPILRDWLVTTLKPGDKKLDEFVDMLLDRLLVDFVHGGIGQTTRVMEAIETLQSVVNGLRENRFSKEDTNQPPAGKWILYEPTANDQKFDADVFDEEWQWLSSYVTWQSAWSAYLYPENSLLPTLAPEVINCASKSPKSQALTTLLESLHEASILDPISATAKVNDYDNDVFEEDQRLASIKLSDNFSVGELRDRRDAIKTVSGEMGVDDYRLRARAFLVPMLVGLQLQHSGYYTAALGWFENVYAMRLAIEERTIDIKLAQEHNDAPTIFPSAPHWTRDLNPYTIAKGRPNPFTRFTLITIARCLVEYADSQFATDTSESVAAARSLYLTAKDILFLHDLDSMVPTDKKQVLLLNPVIDSLRQRVNIQLVKIRSSRNIAGLLRQIELLLPPIAGGATLAVVAIPRSTPYRYSTLIERTKQIAAVAQQIETSYLAALEKRDLEAEKLKREGFAVQLGDMTVTLQTQKETQADDSIELANRQQQRSTISRDRYQEWLNKGLNDNENQQIAELWKAHDYRKAVIWTDAAISTAQFASSWWAALIAGAVMAGKATLQSLEISAETRAQVSGIQASYERRANEWRLQHDLAEQDVAIGKQQVQLANDQKNIATQEVSIAITQRDQAKDMETFLKTKFTSQGLYDWMIGILREVYAYFLQQATSMASLAETQLAFDRAQPPLNFIQRDYWKTPPQTSQSSAPSGGAQDRGGLTGSARLLEDVYRLDQYAFETDKRRLNLTQTFSLARLAPFEFQLFKETGSLPFETPMALFDRGFPGHYMRLIKRVRTSLVALIPPNEGIRATLSSIGCSRVVVGSDLFQTVALYREPQIVALTSPMGATGVFDLDPQPELLQPFEGMGVDARWEFSLPKAANAFDYTSIADVLITIEYTALHSFDYQQQVIKKLDPSVSGDRAFSVRSELPDEWYDLNNPLQAEHPWEIRFETECSDFPPNLVDTPRIEHLLAYVVVKEGAPPAAGEISLSYRGVDDEGHEVNPGPLRASLVDKGVINTRRTGGKSAWGEVLGHQALGRWSLLIEEKDEHDKVLPLRGRILAGEIEDVFVVFTFSGKQAPWPSIL